MAENRSQRPMKIDPLRTTVTESGVKWGLIGKVVGFLTAISLVAVVGLYIYMNITTGAIVSAANDFLTNVKQGNLSQAYASTSGTLKANQEEERFSDELSRLAANDFSVASWTSRLTREKDVLDVNIDIGKKKPLIGTLVLTQQSGGWKVSMFADTRRLYVGPGVWFETPPTDATVRAMAKDSFALLSAALEAGEFESLYDTMAPTYTVRNSPASLPNQYKPLLDAGIDLSEIRGMEPVLDTKPAIQEIRTSSGSGETTGSVGPSGGVLERARSMGTGRARSGTSGAFYLVFEGHFPAEKGNIPFKLSYHYEHPEWLLHSIIVNYPGL